MDRERAIQFCHKYAQKQFYQPIIFVPGIIEVEGKWNDATKELARICLAGIKGKSILDLGCNIGFFVREALNLGANLAIGVDHDPIEMDIAIEISKITQDDAIWKNDKIEIYEPDRAFDVVLMLNVLHVVDDPKAIINRYMEHSKVLIIEHLESQSNYFPKKPDCKIASPRCFGYRILSSFGLSNVSNSSVDA